MILCTSIRGLTTNLVQNSQGLKKLIVKPHPAYFEYFDPFINFRLICLVINFLVCHSSVHFTYPTDILSQYSHHIWVFFGDQYGDARLNTWHSSKENDNKQLGAKDDLFWFYIYTLRVTSFSMLAIQLSMSTKLSLNLVLSLVQINCSKRWMAVGTCYNIKVPYMFAKLINHIRCDIIRYIKCYVFYFLIPTIYTNLK
jgi:hypothetical protein